MPRQNPPRAVAGERDLARRIAYERERRGWTYAGLAKRLTDAGCPINQSAIYKIEKSDPPRRITVAELLALAVVFSVDVPELLIPPEVVESAALADMFIEWNRAWRAAAAAQVEQQQMWDRLRRYVADNPQLHHKLKDALDIWSRSTFGEEQRAEAGAYWMWKITDSSEWEAEFARLFDQWREQQRAGGAGHGQHRETS